MLHKTIFAGFGGQGILMMGYALSFSAMKEGKETTFLPSYGAEMRGGTANCTVVISSEEIASPIASEPDSLVIMNTPSLIKFQNSPRQGALIFINSSLVNNCFLREDLKVFKVAAGDLAENLGNIRVANMVILGAFLKRTKVVSVDTLLSSLKDILPPHQHHLIELNKKAIQEGFNII